MAGKKLTGDLERYATLIRENFFSEYPGMLREAGGALEFPFLTPGSKSYSDVLWDWDSWLANVALRQIVQECGDPDALDKIRTYERGCVQNFLSVTGGTGYVPIYITRDTKKGDPENVFAVNVHKPCLAQQAAFLIREDGGDAEWIRSNEGAYALMRFVNGYRNHRQHECGLYFWVNDFAIGVDNDPCTFYRPPRSSGSIYLNCLMAKEYEGLVYVLESLGLNEVASNYRSDLTKLRGAIQEHMWDERDGFFYNVDLNLTPVDNSDWLHTGMPRDYPCLIQRIGVWSGFLAMWAGIATPEQAERIVAEHYRNPKTFNAGFGVRTLSKMEKMYNLRGSGNPSSWLGPIWGVSNYLTFRGLVKYGFEDDAAELAEKTIRLFGRDIDRFGAMHEYYQPENGEPITNRGFQNWNMLVLNMIAWMEGKKVVEEF